MWRAAGPDAFLRRRDALDQRGLKLEYAYFLSDLQLRT